MFRAVRPILYFGLLIQFILPISAQSPSVFVPAANPLRDAVASRVPVVAPSAYLLKKFYEARDYSPAWIEEGHPKKTVTDLLNAIKQSDREGLNPLDYHLKEIGGLLTLFEASAVTTETMAQLEILLTDAFLSYGSDLVSGRTNPYDVDDDWFAGRRTGDLPLTLERAIELGNVRGTLKELLPTNPMYQRMRDALARYRQFEKSGGWPVIADGKPIKRGDSDRRVVALRKRLFVERDLNQKPNSSELFDASVERGLKHFQARMGLDPDGVLGAGTIKTLNVSAKERVQQIRINMERCRWLPDDLGERHIFVNVPSFTLQVVDNERTMTSMRVVVGRKMRQTPVFSSTMTHLVFNPPWSVPIMVARTDILDHLREEPDYLTTHNFDVYDGYDDNARPVDASKVDWTKVTSQNLTYKFRQKPGALNALGRIKFLLPNRFDVYLHDTPSRSLFSKTVRDFSSGCIRVEKPVQLAQIVLGGEDRWPKEKIEAAINKNSEQIVVLPKPIPVHLMYWTFWVDEWNVAQFREDIYDRDTALSRALNREIAL